MPNITRRVGARSGGTVLSSLAWQYTAVAIRGIAQLFVLAVLSRLLSPEDFGTIGAAMIFIGFAAMFSQLGVAPALIQRPTITAKTERVALTTSLLFAIVMLMVLWVSAELAASFFGNPTLTAIVRVLSLTFIFSSISSVGESLLERDMMFRELMWVNFLSYLIGYAVVGVSLALHGWGVWALAAALVAQSIVKAAVVMIMRPLSFNPLLSGTELKELLGFGAGLTLARLLNYLASQADNLVVGRVLGPAFLGIYSRAYQLMMLPATYFAQALERVMFPAFARVQSDRERVARLYLSGTAMVSLVAAPLSIIMIVEADNIVLAALGEQWGDTVVPFKVLAVGVLFRTTYKIGDSLAKALGAVYKRSAREGFYALAVTVGSILGVPWGLKGVACGVMVAVFFNFLSAAHFSIRMLELTWFDYLKCHLGGLVMAAAMWLGIGLARMLAASMELPGPYGSIVSIASGFLVAMSLVILMPQCLGRENIAAIARILENRRQARLPTIVRKVLHRIEMVARA